MIVSDQRLSTSFVVVLNRNYFVSLDAILVQYGARFRATQVGVLMGASAMRPSFPRAATSVDVRLLLTGIVNAVVSSSAGLFYSRLNREICDVASVTNDGNNFKSFRRPSIPRATISAPIHVCVVQVENVSCKRSIFRCVCISAQRTSESFTKAVNTQDIRRGVAVTFFL